MRARDIAAEKQIEEVIAKEHALLRALIDTVPDRIYAKDAEGRFIVCNTAVDRKFGVAKSEQIIGKTDFDFYPQELAARYHQDDQMIMELNQPLINHEESTVDFAGNRLWTLTTKIPMRDSQGQIVGLVGTSHDITERRRMEEALNTERNLLRTLIDNLPDAVFVKDLECRKIIANPVDVRAMGAQSEAEVIGKTDDLFFSAETAATSFAEDQSVLQTGIPILGREGSYFDKQGNKLYVLSFKMPLRDEHGTIVGIVGATHDITEQKRFQEALQRERTILRTLIDNIPDAIWVKDIQSRKVISNLADVRFMGFQSEAEVLGKDDFDLFPKELADGFYADDQSAIQTGKPIIDREEYLFDEQGNKRWLFTSKLPLRDENNQIIGLVGIGRDITEQKKARETLQQERNLLRILIDNLPDLIFFKDTQGRYILDNLPHLRSLGAENQEEIIGKTSYDFNPPELAKLYTEDEIKVVQSGKPMLDREEIAVHRDTGEKYWHLTSRVPLFDSQGKVTGIVGIARDITERKHAEEERERLIKELQEAAADIKILSGLVPICSSCKKIRDDKGYWTQLEGYIQAHSEAKFSHGVCPDCMKKLYPNFVPKKKE
jgi:PAS domain S-box-containing protein